VVYPGVHGGSPRLYKTVSVTTPIVSPVPPASFTFQPIPMGSVWTGTIQVLQAPSWAFNQCTIGGVIWAEWTGYQPSPVLQAMAGEVIVVTSTGLSPNTLYQATLIGTVDQETDYVPVWPEASPTTLLGSSGVAEINVPANSGPGFTTTIQTGLPGQVLAIQFASSGGTCLGLRIQCSNGPGNRTTTSYPQNAQLLTPWWFVPIQDSQTTITIDPLQGSRLVGGTFQGILRTCVIAGPLFVPVLQSGWDTALGGPNSIGQTVDQSIPPTSNASIIASPPIGAIIRVKRISATPAVAPAAIQAVTVRGTLSGAVYWRDVVNVNLLPSPTSGMNDFYVADSGRDDPCEGLTAFNNASQAVFFTITYDIEPYPQGIEPSP
jgi:hypothetical protein